MQHSAIVQHPRYFSVIGEVAECARQKMPSVNGRLVKAVEIALSGGVRPSALVQGGYHVASQSGGDGYEVNGDSCTCPDYVSRQPEDPELVCKHIIATWLYRRTVQRLSTPEYTVLSPDVGCWAPVDANGTPCHASGSACTHQAQASAPAVPDALRNHLCYIQGRPFVKYAGLLQMAHQMELQSLTVRIISATAELALAEATATFQNGMTFTEIGDATPQNVNKKVAPHFIRMAATRAKARCLRDALGVELCSVEELSE